MDTIVSVLNTLAPLVGILLGQGFAIKYLPFLKKVSNSFIPLLGAITAYLTMFGASTAHAGILGDIVHQFGFPAKLFLSVLISHGTSKMHDTIFRQALNTVVVPALGK